MVNILIVISSNFGANVALAAILENVLHGLGAATRIRRVETDPTNPQVAAIPHAEAEDLEWADGFVFSSPSHTGLLSAAMKAFVDTHHDAAVAGKYLNKTFTAMATSGFAHAGQERVVDNLNAIASAWGCVLVTPSTANADLNRLNGNPFGLSFVLQHGKIADAQSTEDVMKVHFKRFVRITRALTVLHEDC